VLPDLIRLRLTTGGGAELFTDYWKETRPEILNRPSLNFACVVD